MSIKSVYLAGTARKGEEFAEEWRKKATHCLELMGVCCINPFRGKFITQDCQIYNPIEVVTRDLYDIRRSDLVLAEMTQMNTPYVGTSMEVIAASKFYDKPVVIWANEQMSQHYWIRALSVHINEDLDECIDYIGRMWIGYTWRDWR